MAEMEKDIFDKMQTVEDAFKAIFGDSVHIITKTVRVGGTSNNVYVPKKYNGNPVTIIIWGVPKEDDNGEQITDTRADIQAEREKELQEPDSLGVHSQGRDD